MLERGEAIGLLVILAVMLAATLWVAVRRTPSFGVAFVPVEMALAGWAVSNCEWDDGDMPPPFGRRRGGPPGRRGGGDGGARVREPRRPRPSSGAGTARRDI